jgi:hypothetical protein
MEALLTYRGKRITEEDVVFIRGLIAQNPEDSRWRLSQKLCLAWPNFRILPIDFGQFWVFWAEKVFNFKGGRLELTKIVTN